MEWIAQNWFWLLIGMQALRRAMEICNLSHAGARFRQADLVLNPVFRRSVDMLDFAARRVCVVAGVRAVRAQRKPIAALLAPDALSPRRAVALATNDPEALD